MGLSFADLRGEVVSNTGRTERLDYINKQINKGIEYFNRIWPWKQLHQVQALSVAANDLTVSLPSDFLWPQQLLLINGENSYQVALVAKSFMLARWSNVQSLGSGMPSIAYIDGRVLYFAPKAVQGYQFSLHYYRKMPALVDDADTILVDYLDEAVVAYATSKTFASVEQFDSAQSWSQIAQNEFLTAKDADGRSMGRLDIMQGTGGGEPTSMDPQHDPFVFNDPATANSSEW
jgi:hypothetical protein